MEDSCTFPEHSQVVREIGRFRQQERLAIEICLSQIRCSIEELLAAQEQHQSDEDKLRPSACSDSQMAVEPGALAQSRDAVFEATSPNVSESSRPAVSPTTLQMSRPAEMQTVRFSHVSTDHSTSLGIFLRDSLDEAVPGERPCGIEDASKAVNVEAAGVNRWSSLPSMSSAPSIGQYPSLEVKYGLNDFPEPRDKVARQSHQSQRSSRGRLSLQSWGPRFSAASRLQSAFKYLPTSLGARFQQAKLHGADCRSANLVIQSMMMKAQAGTFSVLERWITVVSQMLDDGILDDGVDFQNMPSANTFHPRSETYGCKLRMVRPTSWKRRFWDVLSILLVLYDIAMMPMAVYEFEETEFDVFMFRFSLTFWTVDIIFSFITGYQVEETIEMRCKQIAFRYLKSWFPIDVLTVMPDWVALLFSGGRGSGHITRLGKAAKMLRVLRSLRILRLFRLLRAWKGLHDTFTSQYMLSILAFTRFVLLMLAMSHFSACAWYGISRLEGDDGWAHVYELHSQDRLYAYLTSLHWAISQLHGSMGVDAGTHLERSYSIFYIIVSLIAASVFVSSVTNLLMKMQKLHQETFLKTAKVLSYLENNSISTDLTARIQSFARHATDVSAMMANEVELLKFLPENLLAELSKELKSLACKVAYPLHKVWNILQEMDRRALIDSFSQTPVSPGSHLFQNLETSGKMFILWRGKVTYQSRHVIGKSKLPRSSTLMMQTASSSFPVDGSFTISKMRSFGKSALGVRHLRSESRSSTVESPYCVAEMNLWTSWQHRGDCIISGYPTIFSISPESLGDVLLSSQSLVIDRKLKLILLVSDYMGQYLAWMNAMEPEQLTDLSLCPTPRPIDSIESLAS